MKRFKDIVQIKSEILTFACLASSVGYYGTFSTFSQWTHRKSSRKLVIVYTFEWENCRTRIELVPKTGLNFCLTLVPDRCHKSDLARLKSVSLPCSQCCGTGTIFVRSWFRLSEKLRSGSDFWQVTVPVLAPVPALYLDHKSLVFKRFFGQSFSYLVFT